MEDLVKFCFLYAASLVPCFTGYLLADRAGNDKLAGVMIAGLFLTLLAWCL